jgi:hypothetical protein
MSLLAISSRGLFISTLSNFNPKDDITLIQQVIVA